MLVESVHFGLSARDIGALRGISGERARQLMMCAAYTWGRREQIDLSGKSVPFKNEAEFVKNLYAGLRFFAQQKFNDLAAQGLAKKFIFQRGSDSVKEKSLQRYCQEHGRGQWRMRM
jgi:hypothetical protein